MTSLCETKLKNKKKYYDILEDVEKKYGKLYMNFLKDIIGGEITAWDQVILKLKSIG